MTDFDNSEHWAIFTTNPKLTSSSGFFVRYSEIVLAALRAAGVFDTMEDSTTAPTTDKLWLDKNFDPAVLKEWDATGASWVPMTYGRLFGRAAVDNLTVTGGTGNAVVVSEPTGFQGSRLYLITPTANNDAATTIQVSGVGTYNVKYGDGSDIEADEFTAGRQAVLFFTGSRFEVIFPLGDLNSAVLAAEAARDRAQEWAENPEDDPVTTGPDAFSALHWAAKAEGFAEAAEAVVADKRDKVIPFVDIASAATVNLDPDVSLAFNVTGDVGITSWGTDAPIGSEILTRFAGAPPITGSADLILPTGQSSWGVTAGEMMLWRKISSTQWKALWGPMEAAAQATAEAGTNNGYYMTALRTAQAIRARAAEYLHVRDQKATNTNGGGSSASTQVRVINTVVVNGITGASLASNVITLPAGTFEIMAKVPNYAGGKHGAHLRVSSAGAVVKEGTPELSGATAVTSSWILGRFTLASPTNLEIAHKITSAQASDGLGVAANVTGVVEVYTDVHIWKVA